MTNLSTGLKSLQHSFRYLHFLIPRTKANYLTRAFLSNQFININHSKPITQNHAKTEQNPKSRAKIEKLRRGANRAIETRARRQERNETSAYTHGLTNCERVYIYIRAAVSSDYARGMRTYKSANIRACAREFNDIAVI